MQSVVMVIVVAPNYLPAFFCFEIPTQAARLTLDVALALSMLPHSPEKSLKGLFGRLASNKCTERKKNFPKNRSFIKVKIEINNVK